MAKCIKVLIAEDHDVVREGLKILIRSDPGLKITGEAGDGQAAVRLAKKLQPDVILMDLAMPKANGLEATRAIRRDVPHSRVLVLSAYQDEDTVQRVVEAGVSGFMTKHSAAEELLTAIREVNQGKLYYSPKIAARMKARRHASFQNGHASQPRPKLTPRESQVVVQIAQGQCNKEIAYDLHLSVKTIEKHRQAAMDKLNLHDIPALTRYAVEKGMVTLPS